MVETLFDAMADGLSKNCRVEMRGLCRFFIKEYEDPVTEQTGASRMDSNLTSIIDKILVNNSARRHLESLEVTKYMPPDSSTSGLTLWRRTYSDHFPLMIEMKVENSDDDVD